MPPAIVALVLASAFMHAAWNAILKRCKDPENAMVTMMLIGGASGCVVALSRGVAFPRGSSLFWCLVSGLLEAGYFATLARALARAPLGTVYTIVRGGALVLVWPISALLLDEHASLVRVVGTAFVILGLAATGLADRAASTAGTKLRSGLLIAAFCSLFVGGYHLAYKLALNAGGAPEAVATIPLVSASILYAILVGSKRRSLALVALRAEPIKILVGGLLGGLGFVVFLFAMRTAGAGVILTLRNTSILFAQVFAFLLGERPKRLAVIGAAIVTGGAILLAL